MSSMGGMGVAGGSGLAKPSFAHSRGSSFDSATAYFGTPVSSGSSWSSPALSPLLGAGVPCGAADLSVLDLAASEATDKHGIYGRTDLPFSVMFPERYQIGENFSSKTIRQIREIAICNLRALLFVLDNFNRLATDPHVGETSCQIRAVMFASILAPGGPLGELQEDKLGRIADLTAETEGLWESLITIKGSFRGEEQEEKMRELGASLLLLGDQIARSQKKTPLDIFRDSIYKAQEALLSFSLVGPLGSLDLVLSGLLGFSLTIPSWEIIFLAMSHCISDPYAPSRGRLSRDVISTQLMRKDNTNAIVKLRESFQIAISRISVDFVIAKAKEMPSCSQWLSALEKLLIRDAVGREILPIFFASKVLMEVLNRLKTAIELRLMANDLVSSEVSCTYRWGDESVGYSFSPGFDGPRVLIYLSICMASTELGLRELCDRVMFYGITRYLNMAAAAHPQASAPIEPVSLTAHEEAREEAKALGIDKDAHKRLSRDAFPFLRHVCFKQGGPSAPLPLPEATSI